ncbi:hypothetical protein G3I35_38875 [Streptomyces sp. SID10815]|nr:hypothetical protein [Streptomyces sp. SID10815]
MASRSSMRRIWRPLVMTSDKLASANAFERRSPYLVRDLIEFSYRLPAAHKMSAPAQGKRKCGCATAPRSCGAGHGRCRTNGGTSCSRPCANRDRAILAGPVRRATALHALCVSRGGRA